MVGGKWSGCKGSTTPTDSDPAHCGAIPANNLTNHVTARFNSLAATSAFSSAGHGHFSSLRQLADIFPRSGAALAILAIPSLPPRNRTALERPFRKQCIPYKVLSISLRDWCPYREPEPEPLSSTAAVEP